MYKRVLIFLNLGLYFVSISAFSQAKKDSLWVDSVFQSLSPEQRIAQLLIIRAYSDRDSVYNDSLSRIIQKWNVGGVCFFKGTPFRQITLTNRWQNAAATPLLVFTDAEWGIGMRLDSAFSFPKQMTLGAIQHDSLIYLMASAIARDCKRIGVQVNLAPVVDINNNPLNPVINTRSFGEDKTLVARKGVFYSRGLQDNGIMATAKHFPGHGDTDSDSHLTLPIINKSLDQLDSMELFPFREMIRHDVGSIMTAHLYLPAYDSGLMIPATLSENVVKTLLKEKMNFHGCIITDALDMQGVTKFFKPGEIEVKALQAGNDILLLPQDVESAVMKIKLAIDSALIPMDLISEKCRKILSLKYKSGLSRFREISTDHLTEDLIPVSSRILNKQLYKEAITLVKNQNDLIPLTFLDRRKIAALSIGDTTVTTFQKTLGKYAPMDYFNLPSSFSQVIADSICKLLSSYNLLIIGIHNTNNNPAKKYGISEETLKLIDTCFIPGKVILDVFGSPYTLGLVKNPSEFDGILVSFENDTVSQSLSAQIIFGGLSARGKLPVTASELFPLKSGLVSRVTRFEYILPEEAGINESSLKKIDSIAMNGIESKAYPGCQILFARKGKIFYQRSFGNPTYGDSVKVRNEDLYDLASLTKVLSTTLAIMKLYEEGKLRLDDPLSRFLPELKGSNKQNINIREILSHQAGFQPWIRFYEKTIKNGLPDPEMYQPIYSVDFPDRVADNMFIQKNWHDSIYQAIINSPLKAKDYKYSDLGFYLLRLVIEKTTGKKLDVYVEEMFYRPLGLTTMGYNPREHFPLTMIMPTENDTIFRKQLIRGDVHDPGAAMLGGVSGHAGLFSDAVDPAIILQMLLNGGEYGGKRYFLPSTVKEFTKIQFPEKENRRGLGFDKPQISFSPGGPSCKGASSESFGHSGFTGTYMWADPINELIYIFLSNRIYPDASNQKISEMNIRTEVHQAMYDILDDLKSKNK
jgi:beta-glucosidase-like glycosyl hydrolase/CubicO group peptidase (beta-lactamase class C family)